MTTLKLHIRCSTGQKFDVEIAQDATVLELKQTVSSPDKGNIPVEQQRLIHKGRVLKDNLTLESYGVEDGNAVHLVKSAQRAPATNAATPSSANAATTAPPTPGASPFGMGGGATAQGMMQNPEMMRSVMSSPLMQGLMDNPELLRQMMMSNPQIRAVMEANPHLAPLFNDPQILRQTMEAARNPAVMQEMMRNQDRAMANIESLPGGYNALRRMYHDVEEPMREAAEQSGNAPNPFASLAGGAQQQQNAQGTSGGVAPTSSPMPNPWSNNTTSTPAQATSAPLPNPWMNSTAGSSGGANNGAAPVNPMSFLAGMNAFQPPPSTSTPNSTTTSATTMPNPWANNATSTSSSTNPAPTGFGAGLGAAGGMPSVDANTTNAMLTMMQNPAMQQMMQSMISNPQFASQLRAQNPMAAQMLEQNPQMFQEMMRPENLQNILQMQQAMGNLQQNGFPMMGGMGGAGMFPLGGVPPATNSQPPEERFATQLAQLEGMGFTDQSANIQALTATNGNVNLAVERLLGSS